MEGNSNNSTTRLTLRRLRLCDNATTIPMAAKSSGQNVTPPQPKDSHATATTTSKTPKTAGRKRNHVTKKTSPNHHQNQPLVDTVAVESEHHQDAKKDNEQQR